MSKVHYINAEELKSLLLKKPELTICDVRGSGEFNSGHIPNAINLPLGEFERGRFAEIKNKDSIVFHCLSGTRTRMNESKLVTAPFKNIYILKNGISEWKKSGGSMTGNGAVGGGILKNVFSFVIIAAAVWLTMHFLK